MILVGMNEIKHNQKLIIESLSRAGGFKRGERFLNTCMNLGRVRRMRLLHLRWYR